MGMCSYSVYLLHGIVLYLSHPFLARVKHASAPGDGMPYWGYILALECGTLCLCLMTYRWIEYPFIQYERRSRRAAKTEALVRSAVDRFTAKPESDPLLASSNLS